MATQVEWSGKGTATTVPQKKEAANRDILFEPYKLNDLFTLRNRMVMAPLTRWMCTDDNVPTQEMADYYVRRAEMGLIIAEGTVIRRDGLGFHNIPGIWNKEQIAGWKLTTDAVHAKGGTIFCQLWHLGRRAHPQFYKDESLSVLAPSATAAPGTIPRSRHLEHIKAKAMTKEEIEGMVVSYAEAAKNAMEAGFDGIELHGANGFLIDQFMHHTANERTDEYGGSPQNMARFPLEVVDAVIKAIGKDRTAIRISPGAYEMMEGHPDDAAVFIHFLSELEKREIAYVHAGIYEHLMKFDYLGGTVENFIRKHYKKTFLAGGSYVADEAADALRQNVCDLIFFGRHTIANPDFYTRTKTNAKLVEYDAKTMLEYLF